MTVKPKVYYVKLKLKLRIHNCFSLVVKYLISSYVNQIFKSQKYKLSNKKSAKTEYLELHRVPTLETSFR